MPSITLYGPISVAGDRTKIREIQFLRAAYRCVHPDGPSLGLKAAKDAVDSWRPNEARHLPIIAGTEHLIRLGAKHANIQTVAPEDQPTDWLFDGPKFDGDLDTDDIPF